jgi:hypothetical protein
LWHTPTSNKRFNDVIRSNVVGGSALSAYKEEKTAINHYGHLAQGLVPHPSAKHRRRSQNGARECTLSRGLLNSLVGFHLGSFVQTHRAQGGLFSHSAIAIRPIGADAAQLDPMTDLAARGLDQSLRSTDMKGSHPALVSNFPGAVVNHVCALHKIKEQSWVAFGGKVARIHSHGIRELGLIARPARQHPNRISRCYVPQHKSSTDEPRASGNRYVHRQILCGKSICGWWRQVIAYMD